MYALFDGIFSSEIKAAFPENSDYEVKTACLPDPE